MRVWCKAGIVLLYYYVDYVETDRVEYILPGGFKRLLAELAQIQWPEESKRCSIQSPEVAGDSASGIDQSLKVMEFQL